MFILGSLTLVAVRGLPHEEGVVEIKALRLCTLIDYLHFTRHIKIILTFMAQIA
jgi:hypothetical protein